MDEQRFDAALRELGRAVSRRQAIGGALAALIGSRAGEVGAARGGGRERQAGRSAGDGRSVNRRTGDAGAQGACIPYDVKHNRCMKNRECCTNWCEKKGKPGRNAKDGLGRCRCRKWYQSCRMTTDCCVRGGQQMQCIDHICTLPAATVIPTGGACAPGNVCQDAGASCVAYEGGQPAGTYCLKAQGGSCGADSDCASWLCSSGVCTVETCMVCPGGSCTYQTIQAAINGESAGAVIAIEAAIYPENLTAAKNLTLKGCRGNRVTLAGGAGADGISLSAGATVTVIRFDISGYSGNGVTATGNATAVLQFCTVNQNGVGLKVQDGNGTIEDTTLDGNTSGGINANTTPSGLPTTPNTLTIKRCTISNNGHKQNWAGGVSASWTSVAITDTTIDGNTGDYGAGVALGDKASPVTIMGATVISNNTGSTGAVGGGIYLGSGTASDVLTLTIGGTTRITGNTSPQGAGIFADVWANTSQNIVVLQDDVEISGNTSSKGGAVFIDGTWQDAGSTVTMKDRATVKNNTAGCAGAGVWVYSNQSLNSTATLILQDSALITGNTSAYGSGVTATDTLATVTGGNSTRITGNLTTGSAPQCVTQGSTAQSCPTNYTAVSNCSF